MNVSFTEPSATEPSPDAYARRFPVEATLGKVVSFLAKQVFSNS
jgi:hypothetical protein